MAANASSPEALPRANSRLLSAAGTVNATIVKASAAQLFELIGYNARASAVYFKLYDKATSPDENDTPTHTIYLPASSAFAIPLNFYFPSGLSYRMTTAGADNSTAALTAADILALNVIYT